MVIVPLRHQRAEPAQGDHRGNRPIGLCRIHQPPVLEVRQSWPQPAMVAISPGRHQPWSPCRGGWICSAVIARSSRTAARLESERPSLMLRCTRCSAVAWGTVMVMRCGFRNRRLCGFWPSPGIAEITERIERRQGGQRRSIDVSVATADELPGLLFSIFRTSVRLRLCALPQIADLEVRYGAASTGAAGAAGGGAARGGGGGGAEGAGCWAGSPSRGEARRRPRPWTGPGWPSLSCC